MAQQKKYTDTSKKAAPTAQPEEKNFVFNRANYKLLFIGLGLIVLGFILMIGGGTDDPNSFSHDIFSFRRLTLAPILIIAGYIVEIFAIMKRPKSKD